MTQSRTHNCNELRLADAGKEVTLVKFEIPTGRKHQIRAQSAFHGFPLLGDRAYGGR